MWGMAIIGILDAEEHHVITIEIPNFEFDPETKVYYLHDYYFE